MKQHYDVIIIGGAMLGSSVAWFTSNNPDFQGNILVIERDPSYETASTSHTNSCIRQQFSNEINIRVSQFGVDFIKNIQTHMGPQTPAITLQNFGYMYLANSPEFAKTLRDAQQIQANCGAGTQHMTPAEIAEKYPFYHLDDILAANHNLIDEGYFDGNTLFDWWRRCARNNGVAYIHDEVVAITNNPQNTRVNSVTLASGEVISCGQLVNASGPRAALTAAMAGIKIPVEPRKRYTFIFAAQTPLTQDLPLTIDPTGLHFRTDGAYYMAGCAPEIDLPVEPDDFTQDHTIWEEKIWPTIAHRIPQFDALRLIRSWTGHYAFNTLDQNAILGPHNEIENFMFINGFSGHGFQQAPAMGRGMSELLIYGQFRTLDLTPFSYDRIVTQTPFTETAII